MSAHELEKALKDLPRIGTLVKDRPYRQVWRFEHGRRAYYLKFYPRQGSRLKRLIRGSPATREFLRLQWLQKADIPAPRAVAVILGFRLNHQIGDAVILHAIEPSLPLDQYLNDLQFNAEPVPDHLQLAKQVRSLVSQLAQAGLGHGDLHLGNFLLHGKQLYLLDAYAVRKGGLRRKDVMLLGLSAARYATRTDLCRGWEMLIGDGTMPALNSIGQGKWRKSLQRITRENRYFGRLNFEGWSGVFFKQTKFPQRWSAASRFHVIHEDWQLAWPLLLKQIGSDQLTAIKRTASGDVLAGEVVLGGRPLPIIIKRPRRKFWYRYLLEIIRPGRAKRAWIKSWKLVVRDLPAAWPILLMEKRVLGYVTDAMVIFERIPGPTLASANLDEMTPNQRDMLFRRTGGILRKIEEFGFSHFDAKATNWIICSDEKRGPTPILIDVDGIRSHPWTTAGIRRLLRSMKDHPQYSIADSLSLCQGYAPHAPLV